MSCPSIERIETLLQVSPEDARTARGLMDGSISPDSFSSVVAWVKQCHHPPRRIERVLLALNEVLEMHGVEGMGVQFSACEDGPPIEYLNTGDTYANTVIYNRETGTFRIASWGDVVEAWERKHGRQE